MDQDRENMELLEELWLTPVGRRWVLKAGLGSLVAGLVGRPAVAAARVPAAKNRFAAVGFQFALGELEDVSGLVLVANGERIDLRAHNQRSRTAIRARGGVWGSMDVRALSHYADGVTLPADRTSFVRVEGRRGGRSVVVSEIWHAPEHATLRLAEASHRLTGTLKHVTASNRRLTALGLESADLKSAAAVADLETIADGYQTASALTMTHPSVTTIDPEAAATTKALLGQTPEVTTLGSYIGQMQRAGRDFATLEEAVDADGSPSVIEIEGEPATFSTIHLDETDQRFRRTLGGALRAGIGGVRDDPELGAVIDRPLDEDPGVSTKTWIQPEGMVAQPERYGDQLRTRAGVQAKLKNAGSLSGTRTVLRDGYADGKVPVRLYNNYLRWIWVYVQYLGADGKNLSQNPNAKWPDTKYSKSVCVVPQVFTVFGVPLWDTNTVDFTLEFPEDAHTARLLYCGLGAELAGGSWRQYFPADAYKDKVAPEDEVLAPAIVTGVLTVGLNVFALATDISISELWRKIKAAKLLNGVEDFDAGCVGIVKPTAIALGLTKGEALALSVVSGGALYVDIAHSGESVKNLWNLLLRLASVIPKLFFNRTAGIGILWEIVGLIVAGEAGQKALIGALPVMGQVFGIVSVVGDVASLAQVGYETAVSPWVIENEVSLTYPVTVTISRDPRSSTFPATARSWRLEALVDGALAFAPIAGEVNEGGRLRSDPLVLEVSAPFGGKLIQWSIVFLDDDGVQVGTGVSEQFANNDPGHPAETVTFAITQIPVVMTDRTAFKRASTTAYSQVAGGYTWSDQVKVTGTVTTREVGDVAGAAVATMAGVGGLVWKEGDRYYLRGVPLAQNGPTIQLGLGTHEGWARRPFLLLDAFVDPRDEGNHVLVEPDDESGGYHVRKVSLDPVTGAVSWDRDVVLGRFELPVSACALHASGRVVAVNTDSGRLGWLEPVDTAPPGLAAYAAGAGEQVGLLSSPVAVAVTNPGVVLVLEAAARQLSAFDLNGNPVRYFGNDQAEFVLALDAKGTYLDVAVDGASQIYLLYFTGDGSDANAYHIDVCNAVGEPIATHSPGANIPHLAVDYWRSVYVANYSPLINLGTDQPHTDPALKVREPSFSRFDPTRSGGKQ
jgi:hypothetical protein